MKIKIELTESEIQHALQKEINKKFESLNFEWHESNKIKIEGSVRFKKKAIRKEVARLIATVEVYR